MRKRIVACDVEGCGEEWDRNAFPNLRAVRCFNGETRDLCPNHRAQWDALVAERAVGWDEITEKKHAEWEAQWDKIVDQQRVEWDALMGTFLKGATSA